MRRYVSDRRHLLHLRLLSGWLRQNLPTQGMPGRTEELKQLAAEIVVVFESREVQREAMVALLLFQQACVEDRITGELPRQIAAQIWRERSSPL